MAMAQAMRLLAVMYLRWLSLWLTVGESLNQNKRLNPGRLVVIKESKELLEITETLDNLNASGCKLERPALESTDPDEILVPQHTLRTQKYIPLMTEVLHAHAYTRPSI